MQHVYFIYFFALAAYTTLDRPKTARNFCVIYIKPKSYVTKARIYRANKDNLSCAFLRVHMLGKCIITGVGAMLWVVSASDSVRPSVRPIQAD